MLVRTPRGVYEVIDFRETAPDAAFEDMYKDNINGSIFGGLARYATSECGISFRLILDCQWCSW